MATQTLDYSRLLTELENWKVSVSGLIVKDDKILTVQQNPYSKHRLRGCRRLPTGKLMAFEDPISGVKRKILEETGIETIIDKTPLNIRTIDPEEEGKAGIMVLHYEGRPVFNCDTPQSPPKGDTINAEYIKAREFLQCAGWLGRSELKGRVIERIEELARNYRQA